MAAAEGEGRDDAGPAGGADIAERPEIQEKPDIGADMLRLYQQKAV